MIKREDLSYVEDAVVVEGIDNFEQEIDKLLSNKDVLRYKEFKLLFLVYDINSMEMSKKVLDRSKRSEYDKIFYIDRSLQSTDNDFKKQITDCDKMITDTGYELRRESIFISDRVWTLWTVTWK